jgi:hypothetical protein
MTSSFARFHDHTQRRATVGSTLLGRVISSSQRPLPDNTQHRQQTNIHAAGGIRTHDRSRRAAVDLRLRPRGHWDRSCNFLPGIYQTLEHLLTSWPIYIAAPKDALGSPYTEAPSNCQDVHMLFKQSSTRRTTWGFHYLLIAVHPAGFLASNLPGSHT